MLRGYLRARAPYLVPAPAVPEPVVDTAPMVRVEPVVEPTSTPRSTRMVIAFGIGAAVVELGHLLAGLL